MNVPIRALSLATTIFWILLVSFIAVSAFSLKDLNFSLDEPKFTVTADGKLLFSLPLSIENRGYCDLKDFQLTVFFDTTGRIISAGKSCVPIIQRGKSLTLLHNATLSIDDIAKSAEHYLFNDANLTAQVTAGLTFADFVPAQISTNFTFSWGAPLYNFSAGQIDVAQFNATHSLVSLPISFENHAAFDLEGTMRIVLFDSADSLVGESQTRFQAEQHALCHERLEFYVPLSAGSLAAAQRGHCNVYFSTALFEYGPLVIHYG
ncbi:MAG: hypothetical protein N3E52_02860 [Candidatus Bathyarchaeota archaeon]|nr:hypothetical protein [Candidatus Bathyarchaeota archaeon]